MRLRLEREIPCDIDTAWQAECDPDFLNVLSWPFLSFFEEGKRPRALWHEGETRYLTPRLLGVVPLGHQKITVERLDTQAKSVITYEEGTFVHLWRHKASFRPIAGDDAQKCCYRDEIEFEAGVLSGIVTLFAWVFYRYRQARRAHWARKQ